MSESGRYIPPHKRGVQSETVSRENYQRRSQDEYGKRKHDQNNNYRDRSRNEDSRKNSYNDSNNRQDQNKEMEKGEIPYNRRRDFSQGSKFNTKNIEGDNNNIKCEYGQIKIPNMVEPPVVDSIHDNKNNKMKEETLSQVLIDNSMKEKEKGEEIENEQRQDGLYPTDIRLLTNIAKIKREYAQREAQEEFDEWITHYDDDLRRMYDECVGMGRAASKNNTVGKLGLTYNKFIQIAYECTDVSYNRKKFKYTRPLL